MLSFIGTALVWTVKAIMFGALAAFSFCVCMSIFPAMFGIRLKKRRKQNPNNELENRYGPFPRFYMGKDSQRVNDLKKVLQRIGKN